ncbi:MAG TPA: enoyl-CoA hydratase-related protein [Gemmatimonadaceae bacterium]|jgi:2-(1,2-epoxy-1,2-dihydrophenyl)acetyl-CoA isomerase|nr:enoyl-CoA hydratase-related protein [Gemmatimonadaceae bacterium]
MSVQFILSQTEQGVTQIILNRPDVLNSFNRSMLLSLRDAFEAAGRDPAVRAVLLTGTGRAFCAGQDLGEAMPTTDGAQLDLGDAVRESYNPLIRTIRSLEKPVICAVNGPAVGAGANLALACDIVFASSEASFVQAFSKIGLVPDSGGTFFLPRLVGLARATAMMMFAEKVSTAKAFEVGMIYQVCEPGVLMETAVGAARTLAAMPTRGLWLTKRGLNESFSNNLDTQLDLEEELQRLAGRTKDFTEGVTAFLEKRKPVFLGE